MEQRSSLGAARRGLAAGMLILLAGASVGHAQTTFMVTRTPTEIGDGASTQAQMSRNSRRVVFTTAATIFRPDQGNVGYFENNATDVYLWTRAAGATTGGTSLLSVRQEAASPPLSANFWEGNAASFLGAVADTGVCFATDSDNLPEDDGFVDCPDTNNVRDVYSNNDEIESSGVLAGSCHLLSNGDSSDPSISGDGNWIAFESAASNLLSGDTNNVMDIYVVEEGSAETIVRVSLQSGLSHVPARQPTAACSNPSVNADRTVIAFQTADANMVTTDTNGLTDVYVKVLPGGVVFSSVFIVSTNSRGNEGNGSSFDPSISDDGNLVAFTSNATNLGVVDTNGVADIYVKNRSTGAVERISVGSDGEQANGASGHAWISGDGRFVAFESTATNLVSGDTNGVMDVFVHDRVGGATYRVSVSTAGTQGNGASTLPSIDADGGSICFQSAATNLVAGDTNGVSDIFIRDMLIPPTNDACVSAIQLAIGASHIGQSGAATTQGSASCASSSGHDVWFKFIASCTGAVSISTEGSNYDTVLSVFDDCGGTQLACDDDSGTGTIALISSMNVVAGETYYVRLAGFSTASGTYEIVIQGVPPSNDNCAGATTVPAGITLFENCFATTTLPGQFCGPALFFNDMWFSHTANQSGPLRFQTCGSSFDSVIAVYGSVCPTFADPIGPIACSDSNCDNDGVVDIMATQGSTYLVRVGSPVNGGGGAGILNILNPCPADWNQDFVVDSQDYFDYIEDFLNGDADFNGVDGTDSQDFFDFLSAFFNGC